MSRKKLITGIIIAVLILASAAAGIAIYTGDKNSAEYEAKIEDADRCVEQLDYEQAETLYIEAIEIEPKQPDAYVGVADVYIVQERYEEAEEILETGKKEAGGEQIDKKLKEVKPYGVYAKYIDETVISESGLADTDERKGVNEFASGLISAKIDDFNADEMPELLTVTYGDGASTKLTFELYTFKEGKIELLDEMVADYDDSDYSASKYNVFLKKHDEKNFIIIGAEVLDSGGGTELIDIYEIGSSMEKSLNAEYSRYMEGIYYWLNGNPVSQYEPELEDYDEGSAEAVNSAGISKLTDALQEFGIESDRFTPSSKEGVSMRCIEYNDQDETEIPICYVQHGVYLGEWNIDLGEQEMRYIHDYTDIREE